mgnify:CR=1 FL=1
MPSARRRAVQPTAPPVDKREAILRAAIDVFAERGYFNARVADIARAAGIAAGCVDASGGFQCTGVSGLAPTSDDAVAEAGDAALDGLAVALEGKIGDAAWKTQVAAQYREARAAKLSAAERDARPATVTNRRAFAIGAGIIGGDRCYRPPHATPRSCGLGDGRLFGHRRGDGAPPRQRRAAAARRMR